MNRNGNIAGRRDLLERCLMCMLVLMSSSLIYGKGESNDSILVHSDTSHTNLPEVVINGYLHNQYLSQTPASVNVINQLELNSRQPTSLVATMNSVPGVRMEERSPASYRLSIRGNVIRSPYGIRNVKIYYDDFSLTDAGGNTYLNLIDPSVISRIEILKGPDGSLFGENSGGVVLLQSENQRSEIGSLKLFSGSYGLAGGAFHYQVRPSNNLLNLNGSYQRSDGYRDQSFSRRLFFQLDDHWKYNRKSELNIMSFFSGIHYDTPGGLTKAQFDADPRMSRPATKTQPGSREQNTGSLDNMFFLGVSNKTSFNAYADFTTALWGSHLKHRNYAIPDYESDQMNNLGFRTYLALHRPDEEQVDFKPSLEVGAEGQLMSSHIHTFDNNGGVAGDEQSYSNIMSHAVFGFVRSRVEWKRFIAEMAVSWNFDGYRFKDTTRVSDNFHPVWMPHFAINYRFNSHLSLRATVSKGYSVPTTDEVRPSDQKIYRDLEPETGWNYETGFRLNLFDNRLMVDASVYRYILNNGIISRQNELSQAFFVNAGKIRQTGIEGSVFCGILPQKDSRFIRFLYLNESYTYSFYHFGDYQEDDQDYSGNRVPGVPRTTLVTNLKAGLPWSLSCMVEYHYASRAAMDDANDAYARSYHQLSARISYLPKSTHRINLKEIFLFFDNILNQKYSLGYDINAYGARYYNAAPGRNFQVGISFSI